MSLPEKIESASSLHVCDMDDHLSISIESNTSTSKRWQPPNSPSDEPMALVDSAASTTEGRCLITNVNREYAVEYAHVLQRAAPNALVNLIYLMSICWINILE